MPDSQNFKMHTGNESRNHENDLGIERYNKLRGEIIMQEIICEKCVKCGSPKTIYNDDFQSFRTGNMNNAVCLCVKCIKKIRETASISQLEIQTLIKWAEDYDRENSAPQN